MAFRGWKVEALEFFEGLEAENTRAYWQAHKHVYDTLVRPPMEELLRELEPEFGEWKVFRPYRDVRFSADRSPYKTNIAATIGDGYVSLSADALAAGSGYYDMAPDQLERFRKAVDDDRTGGEIAGIVASARRSGYDIAAHHVLKTAPKGFARDHPRLELLRHKGLIAWKRWPAGAWLGRSSAKDRVVAFLRASEPLTAWLRRHVGPSKMETGR